MGRLPRRIVGLFAAGALVVAGAAAAFASPAANSVVFASAANITAGGYHIWDGRENRWLGQRSGMSLELHFKPPLECGVGWTAQQHVPTEEETMVLATAKIEDFDRFWNTFSTKGAEKRKQHGSKGAHVFRDPNESDRVWAIFDWDEAGWKSFTSDPEVPAIFQEAGFTQGPPKSAEFLRHHDA